MLHKNLQDLCKNFHYLTKKKFKKLRLILTANTGIQFLKMYKKIAFYQKNDEKYSKMMPKWQHKGFWSPGNNENDAFLASNMASLPENVP